MNVSQIEIKLCRTLVDVSDQSLNMILFVNFVLISGSVSMFGVLFNVMNIIVFIRMGFVETTNITLLCLSISDVGVSLFMLAYSVLYNPLLLSSINPELVDAIFYFALGWPKGCFSRISASLTVLAAFERFVCISWPLQVKQWITVPRITTASIAVYIFLFTCTLPVYTNYRLGRRFNPLLNTTSVGVVSLSKITLLEDMSLAILTVTQFSSFLLVFGLTVGTVYKLQQKTKWRNSISTSQQNSVISARDRKLVKMIIYISIVFITCTLPALSGTIIKLMVKDYDLYGKCKNLFVSTFSVFFSFGTVNSTINIFIYTHMSSKFRHSLKTLLKHHTLYGPQK